MPVWLQRIVSAGVMSAFITALAVSACGPLGLLLMLPGVLLLIPLAVGHYLGAATLDAVAARFAPRPRSRPSGSRRPARPNLRVHVRASQLIAEHLAGRAPPLASATT